MHVFSTRTLQQQGEWHTEGSKSSRSIALHLHGEVDGVDVGRCGT